MLNAVVKILKPKLAALPFVERLGGIVTPVTKRDEVCDENGNPIGFVDSTFPVSCGQSAIDCFENGKYQALTPDDSKKSIVYFEQIGGLRFVGAITKGNILCFEGRLRLVAWLNLQKLGLLDDCSYAGQFSISAICAIEGIHKMDYPYTKSAFEIEIIEQTKRSPDIFSKYSYNREIQYLLFPYDYFAIDLKIKLSISKACLEELTLGNPIECIEL